MVQTPESNPLTDEEVKKFENIFSEEGISIKFYELDSLYKTFANNSYLQDG